jgi:hypothetical protein
LKSTRQSIASSGQRLPIPATTARTGSELFASSQSSRKR